MRIKGKVGQSWDRRSALPYNFGAVAIEKGAFGLPSTTVANFYFFLLSLKLGPRIELIASKWLSTRIFELTSQLQVMVGGMKKG